MKKMTTKLSRKQVKILGVRLDSTSKEQVLRQAQVNIKNRHKFVITTPNPEIVMKAQEDEQLKDILNSSDISIPDGIGLVAAVKFLSLPRPKAVLSRLFILFAQGLGVGFSIIFDKEWVESELKLIKGREVFYQLMKIANKKQWKVALVGDKYHSAKKASEKLSTSYLKLRIFPLDGPDLKNNGEARTVRDTLIEKRVVEKINKEKPQLLFIGFGAPKQEKWLYRWYEKLDFNAAMVVGGTFDYIAESKQLPPKWVEDINLEWLWRLVKGDQKVKRVLKAFPRFAWAIYWQKLVKN